MNALDSALSKIIAKDGLGVYASADYRYRGAIFGRDSLEVAEDLMTIKPKLVEDILTSLAMLQGTTNNNKRDEKSGKIHHEYRSIFIDEKPVDTISRLIFDELAQKWGGSTDRMIYYGSVDASPLFVKVLSAYCDQYSPKILSSNYINKEGVKLTFQDSLQKAVIYLLDELKHSKSGLLCYRTNNSKGLQNQAWKDSKEFYMHDNGELVNHKKPVASIEVQGLVYDAMICAQKYLPSYAQAMQKAAQKIQKNTIDLLWLPKDKYFALGTDFDNNDKIRIITTKTANPASLLNSAIFSDLELLKQKLYISSIVRTIFSKDFLTDAGIRSRALSHGDMSQFWDYHGAYTTWPKETYDIAKGLRKFGFPKLAQALENRIYNGVKWSQNYPEYFYVDKFGRVLKHASPNDVGSDIVLINSTNVPEQIQAWTLSSVIAIEKTEKTRVHQTWQKKLEDEILSKIKDIKRLDNRASLRQLYPEHLYKLERSNSLQFDITNGSS